jgi:predicted nucleic acid-binding protein
LVIVNRCEYTDWQLINSDAIAQEIQQTPDLDKQRKLDRILSIAKTYIVMTHQIEQRAEQLIKKGFKIFDALHIACAESGNVDIFLTTDDRLLRRARGDTEITVDIENPVQWLMSIIQSEGETEDESSRN